MKGFTKACMMGVGLILMFSLIGAAEYQFGSKVALGDTDVQRLLYNFTYVPVPKYWDIGPAGYDEGDPVYLDIVSLSLNRTDSNDLRLTQSNSFAAGTKVTSNDNDINKPLSLFGDPDIVFTDLYGITGYDFADPVYVSSNKSPTSLKIVTNDVRLNRVGNLMAGTKVLDYHPDHEKGATVLVYAYRFYNVNGDQDVAGNPIYGYEDNVYIDTSTPAADSIGFVETNNVRLTSVV